MTILITRDLVARPEEAWASLASYCGLDPTNAKPLEAHKKFVSIKVQMFDHVYSLITFENYPSCRFTGILSEGLSSVGGF